MSGAVLLDRWTGKPVDEATELVREHDALHDALRMRGFEQVARDLELADKRPDFLNTRQDFESLVAEGCYADLTAVTATSETALWTPSATLGGIPAWDCKPGKLYCLRAGGIITTTTANATITPRFGTTTGGVAMGASAAIALTASQTNVPWSMTANMFIRSTGNAASTVTAVMTGNFTMGTMSMNFGGTTITTGDGSIASGIFIGWTFSAASQSITPKYVVLTSLN